VANFIASEGKYHQVIDGITKRTLKQKIGFFEPNQEKIKESEKFYPLKIIPHRCPNCGWDLPVTPFHLVFPCENCKRIWRISESGYLRIRGEKAKIKQKKNLNLPRSLEYYPFWVFKTKIPNEKKLTIKDAQRILPSEIGLFKVSDKSKPFLFYVLASEIRNLNKIPDIGLAFTRTQPDLQMESDKIANLKGVFISEEDAKELAEIMWVNLLSSKQNLELKDWKNLVFEDGKVVWVPFYEDGIFLRDAEIGYGFQKAAA